MARTSLPSRVMASQFDPTQGPATFYDPRQRLAQLAQEFQTNPGAAPGGSGSTGLMSGDAQGYSRLLERQQEFLKLQDALSGGKGINTRVGGTTTTRTLDPATVADNSFAFTAPFSAGVSGQNILDRRAELAQRSMSRRGK